MIERTLRDRGDGIVVVETRPWENDPATDTKATLIAEVLAALQARAAKEKAPCGRSLTSVAGDVTTSPA